MTTEEKIVAKALEMFNERGVEYVGMRELAGSLEMRVSNITYYFPTKDDLVNRLSLELEKLNSGIMVEDESLTMLSFLERFGKVFNNHVQYRCLMLSFVHLMARNKPMAKRYKQTQNKRYSVLTLNLLFLEKAGYLNVMEEGGIDFLVSVVALVNRFWVSEATISYSHLGTEEQILHYKELIAKFLVPYASTKGNKEIRNFLQTIQ